MISSTPVVNKINHDIKIFLKEKEIKENLNMVLIRVANIGNEPIKKDDFNHLFRLEFSCLDSSKLPKIFDASVKETKPDSMRAEINVVPYPEVKVLTESIHEQEFVKTLVSHHMPETQVRIEPILLNPKDEFTLSLLMTDFDFISTPTRIVGGDIIKENKEFRSRFSAVKTTSLILFVSVWFLSIAFGITLLIAKLVEFIK